MNVTQLIHDLLQSGLKQRDICQRTGLPQATVAHLSTGRRGKRPSTRQMRGAVYRHEMSDADHTELLQRLRALKGQGVLSGSGEGGQTRPLRGGDEMSTFHVTEHFAVVPTVVNQDTRLTFTQHRVLIALLSFRDKHADTVWPTRQQIAERCGGLHISKISQATTALERLGWLRKQGKGGYSKATHYQMTYPAGLRPGEDSQTPKTTGEALPADPKPVAELITVARSVTLADPKTRRVTYLARGRVADPVTHIEQTNNKPRVMSGRPDDRQRDDIDIKKPTLEKSETERKPEVGQQRVIEPAAAQAIIAYLNAKTGRSYRLVAPNLRLVQARLREGATVEQLKSVINAKVRQWGQDPKMAEYLRPETLFGATKFEQYLGQLTASGACLRDDDARFAN